ncbi:MAG: ATP-binding protein, partial [Anaerovorax sp.]
HPTNGYMLLDGKSNEFSEKIQVALFDDRLEVTSPGMLDNEITIEKMKTGLSKIRNKGIAVAFSYMNVVEAWGSGIPKMFQETREYGLREPELIDMGSDFRVNLYRKVADVDANGVINPKKIATNATNSATNATDSLTEDEKKVIEAIRTKADATQKEMQTMTGITLGTIKRMLPRLQEKGFIERVGNRRSGKWQIND